MFCQLDQPVFRFCKGPVIAVDDGSQAKDSGRQGKVSNRCMGLDAGAGDEGNSHLIGYHVGDCGHVIDGADSVHVDGTFFKKRRGGLIHRGLFSGENKAVMMKGFRQLGGCQRGPVRVREAKRVAGRYS